MNLTQSRRSRGKTLRQSAILQTMTWNTPASDFSAHARIFGIKNANRMKSSPISLEIHGNAELERHPATDTLS